jgi:hypothetical protein
LGNQPLAEIVDMGRRLIVRHHEIVAVITINVRVQRGNQRATYKASVTKGECAIVTPKPATAASIA